MPTAGSPEQKKRKEPTQPDCPALALLVPAGGRGGGSRVIGLGTRGHEPPGWSMATESDSGRRCRPDRTSSAGTGGEVRREKGRERERERSSDAWSWLGTRPASPPPPPPPSPTGRP
ncbi:hypothetical protein LX32DRAFT_277235 [Colletotrichum zoysiae]|uniref:Uncharacterized protein n=1 Tax=Colletotrichum zoysiae TaxID=1216348 RepID=A0AAD9H4E6_9PEZI|nr:hypothetical protein LX32DRAFT_277235 [Colletotrichum zoysiae]